jgi:glycosyltransferase involved in cell wall biosynthesis
VRVLHIGNILNSGYHTVRLLRARGVDAYLVIDSDHREPANYPEWEAGRPVDEPWIVRLGSTDLLKSFGAKLSRLRSLARSFDLVHTWSVYVEYAEFLGRPFVHSSNGYEIDHAPFVGRHQRGLSVMFRLNHVPLTHRPYYRVRGLLATALIRRALRRSRAIFCSMSHQVATLERIGVGDRVIPLSFLPMNLETMEGVVPAPREDRDELLVLHPTRHFWAVKGNDLVFKAFARLRRTTGRRARLVTMAWGPDVARSRELAETLGLGADVTWLPKLPGPELRALMKAADVVMDQYVLGSWGALAIEAAALGVPVILRAEMSDTFYPDPPPFLSARTEDDIHRYLVAAGESPGWLVERGLEHRAWVQRNLPKQIERIVCAYEALIQPPARRRSGVDAAADLRAQ